MISLLTARHREPEIMDQPGLDPERHADALRGLARINAASTATSAIWRPLRDRLHQAPQNDLSMLDVACGGGDTLGRLAQRARAAGVPLSVSGCDISATAIAHARRRAHEHLVTGQFFQHDVLASELPERFDIVTCSLFLHHLDDDTAAMLLARLYAATRWLLIVCDLNRGLGGLALAWLGTRLLSRSAIVHADGPRSVRAAFTRAEARHLAARAGIPHAVIDPIWPCRWRLVAERAL